MSLKTVRPRSYHQTATFRKRRQSWSERRRWLTNTNGLLSTPSYTKLLSHEQARPIGDPNRRSSSTLKLER